VFVAAVALAGCYATKPVDWSPDGSRLAVAYGGQVYVIAADGSGVTRLTEGSVISDGPEDADVAWSAEGRSIAFTRAGSVWVVDVETRAERSLAVGTHPSWSPDGRWLAYMVGGTSGEDSVAEIWIANAAGTTAPRRLGSVAASPGDGLDWAPDGERLAVCSDRGLVILDMAEGSEPSVSGDACAGAPDWSPDGRLVVAQSHGLALLTADLQASTALTSFDVGYVYSDRDPAWSSDGRQVAFTRWTGVAVVDVATGVVTRVGPADAEHPAWAPDGQALAVAELDEQGAAVYLIRGGQTWGALALSPRLRPERATRGSTDALVLPRGAASVGTSLVVIQRPLPAPVPIGAVTLGADGHPSVTFNVPEVPPGNYQLYLQGDGGYAWVTELLVTPGGGFGVGFIAIVGWLGAAAFAVASRRAAVRRWWRAAVIVGAALLVGSCWVAGLAYPALLLLGAGFAANRFPDLERTHLTRGNVLAAFGALAACGFVSLGFVAGPEPKSSREIDLAFTLNGFALAVLGLVLMAGGVAWHAGHAIRRRAGNLWLETILLVLALAAIFLLLTGGAHAGSAIWPTLVGSFAAATALHALDPRNGPTRTLSEGELRTARSG
jgi:Tol biopolymer transport system component